MLKQQAWRLLPCLQRAGSVLGISLASIPMGFDTTICITRAKASSFTYSTAIETPPPISNSISAPRRQRSLV